jgi:GR25 family glycosyltransferase involved in LPS biosynthesis
MLDIHIICLESLFDTRGKQTLDFVKHNVDKSLYNKLSVFKAVTPNDFVLEDVVATSQLPIIKQKQRRITHSDLSKASQVACALSHIALWEVCNAQNSPLVIMEDDVCPPNLSNRIKSAAKSAAHVTLISSATQTWDAAHSKVTNFTGTGAYYLTPQGARILLKHARPVSMHVDRYMPACIKAYNLTVFAVEGSSDQLLLGHNPTTLGHSTSEFDIYVSCLQIIVLILVVLLACFVAAYIMGYLFVAKNLLTSRKKRQSTT